MHPLMPPAKWIAFALAVLLLLASAIAAVVERRHPDFNQCPLCGERVTVHL